MLSISLQVALERQERRKLEVAAMDEYALQRMEIKDAVHKQRIEKASEEIRKEKVGYLEI